MLRHTRDPMSGLTHFIGAILAIVALVALLTRNQLPLSAKHYVSFSIFGSMMILLYAASTTYHWVQAKDTVLRVLRQVDHVMIFMFIAATYTPICLLVLPPAWGWSLFGAVWGIALFGLFVKIFWMSAPRWISTGLYLLMGWVVLVAIWPLAKTFSSAGIVWLALGGLFYTVGAVIYALKRPDPWPKVFGFHEIFHVFIMLGSGAHFVMMYQYV